MKGGVGVSSSLSFPDHLANFQTIWKHSRPPGNFPDGPETLQFSFKGYAQNFPNAQKLSELAKTFQMAMPPCHPGFWASGIEILFEEEKKLSPLTWKSAQIGKKRFHFFGRKWRVKDWMHRCRIKTYEMHLPPHPLPHFQNPKYKHCTQLD